MRSQKTSSPRAPAQSPADFAEQLTALPIYLLRAWRAALVRRGGPYSKRERFVLTAVGVRGAS